MRVIVTGRLKQRSYETKEGEKRTVYEVEVDDVGPSLRNASAKVARAQRTGGAGGGGYGAGRPAVRAAAARAAAARAAGTAVSRPAARPSGGQASSGGSRNEDPWASDAGYSDEPPF